MGDTGRIQVVVQMYSLHGINMKRRAEVLGIEFDTLFLLDPLHILGVIDLQSFGELDIVEPFLSICIRPSKEAVDL